MRLLWIGAQKDAPHSAVGYSTEQVPSLVLLALTQAEKRSYDAVLLDARQSFPYSVPHLLDAARRLRSLGIGMAALLPKQLYDTLHAHSANGLLCCQGSPADAVRMLQDYMQARERLEERQTQPAQKQMPVLQLPQGRKLHIRVYGSQSRIGCTTQCLQLSRQLAAWGLSPAVVLGKENYNALAHMMSVTSQPLAIDGIAFLTEAEGAYDCYLYDGGVLDKEKASTATPADVCILVAGCKPWELSATVSACVLLQHVERLGILVSFAPRGGVSQIAALARRSGCSASICYAAWQPDPFSAQAPQYDRLRTLFELQEDFIC